MRNYLQNIWKMLYGIKKLTKIYEKWKNMELDEKNFNYKETKVTRVIKFQLFFGDMLALSNSRKTLIIYWLNIINRNKVKAFYKQIESKVMVFNRKNGEVFFAII